MYIQNTHEQKKRKAIKILIEFLFKFVNLMRNYYPLLNNAFLMENYLQWMHVHINCLCFKRYTQRSFLQIYA